MDSEGYPEYETRQLLEGALPSTEMSRLTNLEAYLLSDGRVLLMLDDGTSVEYASEDSVRELLAKLPASQHILTGLNPYGHEFPSHVSQILTDFARSYGISLSPTALTQQAIRSADAAICHIPPHLLWTAPLGTYDHARWRGHPAGSSGILGDGRE